MTIVKKKHAAKNGKTASVRRTKFSGENIKTSILTNFYKRSEIKA